MITKGYASKSTASTLDGKTWYIPHFGIYDPNKPGKIRVVFDRSAQFKGTSLNQHLMSGPDLTNQLVGVFLRFRQEEVAFMADIEKIKSLFQKNKEIYDSFGGLTTTSIRSHKTTT